MALDIGLNFIHRFIGREYRFVFRRDGERIEVINLQNSVL